MASGSLGTLTLDLIARIGGFTAPLDKAERAASNYAGAQVETQRDGDQMKIIIKQAKREIARDLAQGNGEVTRALTSGYGLRRAAR